MRIMPGMFVGPADWTTMAARLGLAILVGGIVGLNREFAGKSAGLRTHILVSMGAALFVLVPLQLFGSPDGDLEARIDTIGRVMQGITAGIGFLGAGEIFRESKKGGRVRGLTSAAAIWVAAALGVVAAAGLWQLALLGAVGTLAVLVLLKKVERWLLRAHRTTGSPPERPQGPDNAAR
jgi:putative Mg2+ transporter-C (MgtC) family protein